MSGAIFMDHLPPEYHEDVKWRAREIRKEMERKYGKDWDKTETAPEAPAARAEGKKTLRAVLEEAGVLKATSPSSGET